MLDVLWYSRFSIFDPQFRAVTHARVMRKLFGTNRVGRERRECQSRRARAYILVAYNTCLICIYCGGTNPPTRAGAWLSASCASSEDEVASELATAPWVAELPEHPRAICGMLLARTRWGTWVWGHTILQLSAATLYNDSFWVSVLCWFFLHCESINFIQIRLGPQSRGQVRVKIFLQWKRTLLRRWICFSIAKWKSIDEIDENNTFGVAAAIKGGFGDWSRMRCVSHTLRDNLGLFGSRWMPRFSVYMPRANRFQKFSCWLKLPNMTEWQFAFQMWDGVLPDPWDYEHWRVPPEMRVEDLLPNYLCWPCIFANNLEVFGSFATVWRPRTTFSWSETYQESSGECMQRRRFSAGWSEQWLQKPLVDELSNLFWSVISHDTWSGDLSISQPEELNDRSVWTFFKWFYIFGIHRRLSTSLPAWLVSHSKLYFWQAARHYSTAVQFWQVVVNAVNKHAKTDRFVRRLDIPQRLPSNNGKN